jgi:hypothetical protein
MKNNLLIFLLCVLTLLACHKDNDDEVLPTNITFNFNHNWDASPVSNTDFNVIKYTNAHGEEMSISKLRYLISNITFQNSNGGTYILDGHNLVDVTNNTNLSFTSTKTIPTGIYSNVSFTFGFNNEDNYDTNYTNLNSASWNVPAMMGGGYHFMQLEGKFIDNNTTETGYAYHAIRAVDNSGTPLVFQNTFFVVDLGEVTVKNSATFNVEMNIAEWFKNPNTWDLNLLNNMLMPNFNAQVMMYENGQNVFSLKSVNP